MDLYHLSADSAVPGLSRHQVYMSSITVPPNDLLQAFAAVVAPFFRRIHQSGRESTTLASLRDTLLPKLLSGELGVTDAKRVLETSP
jgi:type I restriction enzyme S subunit